MPFQSITAQLLDIPCVYFSSLPNSSINAANTDALSMSDIRRVFDGKRVVLAGDFSIRSIYCDMATFLVTGDHLCPSDAAVENGEKPLAGVNDRRVRAGGRPGMPTYIHERVCQWSISSSLHYIHLSSLDCQESNELLRLVQNADLIIFSSVMDDMSRRMLSQSSISFSKHLDTYSSKVFSLCQQIVEVTKASTTPFADSSPLFLWLTPLALSSTMSKEQKDQFLQIVATGEDSAKMAGFQLFGRLNVSLADNGGFTNNKCGHFSSIGIRLITKLLTEIAAEHWQRLLHLSVFSSPSSCSLSPMPFVVDTTVDTNGLSDGGWAQ